MTSTADSGKDVNSLWQHLKRLLHLLQSEEKRRLLLLLGGICLMGVLDVLGISSVLPFMAVLAKPEIIQSTQPLRIAYEFLGAESINQFLFMLGVVALFMITATNLFTLGVSRAILRFSYLLGHALSERLLKGYLNQPYSFFLTRNSSALMLNVMGEVTGVVHGILVPGMQAIARCVVAACALVLVVIIEPGLALVFGAVFGGVYLILFSLVRRRVSKLGEQSQGANRGRYRLATEVFSGIKDLRLLGREGHYFERIKQASHEYAVTQSSTELVAMAPRYALETIAFAAVLVLVLYLLAIERDISGMLPLLTLYALATYRLLPAFQQVFASLTHVRFNIPSLNIVATELGQLQVKEQGNHVATSNFSSQEFFFKREVRLEQVCYTYEGRDSSVLDKVSLAIKKNTTVGLVGETGSGKTTLVDIVLGLLSPSMGRFLVDDVSINDSNIRDWQQHLGYVPQQIFLSDDTVARNIALGVQDQDIDKTRIAMAARIANIDEFIINQLPQQYDTYVGERGIRLSGGQRQRIGIARALYHDPSVLVLDEATSALDGITEDAIIEAIDALTHKKTIIIIAHRLQTVKDCDVIYVLDGGRLVASGSYNELIANSERFRAMAKVGIRV